jgi:hypothetical protein
MKIPRRQLLQLTGSAAALPAVARILCAQTYPTRRAQTAPTQINAVLNWFEALKCHVPTRNK